MASNSKRVPGPVGGGLCGHGTTRLVYRTMADHLRTKAEKEGRSDETQELVSFLMANDGRLNQLPLESIAVVDADVLGLKEGAEQLAEMETAAIAMVAHANAVPYIAFCSLSDLAGGGRAADTKGSRGGRE